MLAVMLDAMSALPCTKYLMLGLYHVHRFGVVRLLGKG
jgi:hypothetical protein